MSTPVLTLGIDIGTSFSCMAASIRDHTGVHGRPLRLLGDRGLIPSILLYDQDMVPKAIGESARSKWLETGGFLVQDFKLKLGGAIDIGGRPRDTTQIYEDFLQLYIDDLHTQYPELYSDEVVVCVTHPAQPRGIDALARSVEQAAEAVFHNTTARIVHLDEASATVQLIDRLRGLLSFTPKMVAIVDSGGGTTDLALAEAKYRWFGQLPPLTIETVDRIDIGGHAIDRNLLERLTWKGNLDLEADSVAAIEAVRQAKERFNWSTDFFAVPELTSARLVMTDAEKAINPLIDIITQRVKAFLGRYPGRIDDLVLAGGNSRMPLLRRSLQRELDNVTLHWLPEHYLQTAVAVGAAMYGHLQRDTINYRLAYDVRLSLPESGRVELLWRRGDRFPKSKPRRIPYRLESPSFIKIVFSSSEGPSVEQMLELRFSEPVAPGTMTLLNFDVDAGGYLRVRAELMEKSRKPWEHVVRKYLFDLAPPL